MKKYSFFLLIIALCSLNACKKENLSTHQTLNFHWHSMIGNREAAFDTVYSSNGINFNLSDWRYYVSNFILIKEDGSELKIADKVFLIHIDQNDYSLDSIPVGSYRGFKFTLGLDSLTNHSDPTLYPAEHPLALQTEPIHWSWNSGYIFFKAEGKFDSTVAGTDVPAKDFFYHVGLDKFSRTIDFSHHAFSVTSSADRTIGIELDLLKVLSTVNLKTENMTHSFGSGETLANKIANNWQAAFSIE